jgi:hypothetical protein
MSSLAASRSASRGMSLSSAAWVVLSSCSYAARFSCAWPVRACALRHLLGASSCLCLLSLSLTLDDVTGPTDDANPHLSNLTDKPHMTHTCAIDVMREGAHDVIHSLSLFPPLVCLVLVI